MPARQQSLLIRQFIIDEVADHPTDITAMTAKNFGISTQAARNHLKALERDGVLESSGNTKARSYRLQVIASLNKTYTTRDLSEDVVWSQDFKPLLSNVSDNVLQICSIVFSEMLNNAIDHSGSREIMAEMIHTAAMTTFRIKDHGIGIFRKIKKALDLPEERMAILELSKGKFTTSPDNHSGYGIFFSSRMVDIFSLWSHKLFFHHIQPDSDWLTEVRAEYAGTCVEFTVGASTLRTPAEVYGEFCTHPDDEAEGSTPFNKTHVPLRLAQYDREQLVSRSQAKRVLVRFDRFAEVLLDFEGVDFISQAFADEIFRVFHSEHPNTEIIPINMKPTVREMVALAIANRVEASKKTADPQRTFTFPNESVVGMESSSTTVTWNPN